MIKDRGPVTLKLLSQRQLFFKTLKYILRISIFISLSFAAYQNIQITTNKYSKYRSGCFTGETSTYMHNYK